MEVDGRTFGRLPSLSFATSRPPRTRADAEEAGRALESERPSRFQPRGVRSPSWCSTVGRMSTTFGFFTFAPSPGPEPITNEVSSSLVWPKWLISDGSESGFWPWSVTTRIVQLSNG